jgi:MFS family permease
MTASPVGLQTRMFASLRKHRNYRLYFYGQIVSLTGTWMQDTALPWLVIQRTHSPIAVGFLVFCRYLPFTAFGLWAGVLADRVDNRRLLIGTQFVSMVLAAALAVLALIGHAPLWAIYAIAALGGVAVVFDAPSRQALTYQLVGRDELPNAVALNSGLMNAARVVGPAVAGVIIAAAGVAICFVINAASFLAVLAMLLLMRTEELIPVARAKRGPHAIREVVAFILGEPRLKMIIGVTAAVGMLGFNFRVLLPALAQDTLHAGAGVFGALYGCFGAGALAGALLSAGLPHPRWRNAVIGSGVFSTAMLVLAPMSSVWAAAVLLFVTGVGFSVWGATSMAILQISSPDQLRGRVIGVYLLVFAGSAPFGSLLTGWLADVGGTELAFAVAGGVGLAATLVAAIRARRLRPIPDTAVPSADELLPVAPSGP